MNWRSEGNGYVCQEDGGRLFDAGSKDRAQLIVRAVNVHDEMLAFINACVGCRAADELLDFVQNNAEELLAKAEKGGN